MTYKQIILNYLQEAGTWVEGFKLEKVNTKWGWIGNSGGRRCRELAEEGKIERRIEGKYVYYRAIPQKFEIYRVIGNHGETLKQIKLITN